MNRGEIGRREFGRATAGKGPVATGRVREASPVLAAGVEEFIFADVFSRSGLPARERELLTVAVLAAIGGADNQLGVHVPAALECGADAEELIQLCEQITPYAGFPRALNALRAVRAVLEERGLPLPLPVAEVAAGGPHDACGRGRRGGGRVRCCSTRRSLTDGCGGSSCARFRTAAAPSLRTCAAPGRRSALRPSGVRMRWWRISLGCWTRRGSACRDRRARHERRARARAGGGRAGRVPGSRSSGRVDAVPGTAPDAAHLADAARRRRSPTTPGAPAMRETGSPASITRAGSALTTALASLPIAGADGVARIVIAGADDGATRGCVGRHPGDDGRLTRATWWRSRHPARSRPCWPVCRNQRTQSGDGPTGRVRRLRGLWQDRPSAAATAGRTQVPDAMLNDFYFQPNGRVAAPPHGHHRCRR